MRMNRIIILKDMKNVIKSDPKKIVYQTVLKTI